MRARALDPCRSCTSYVMLVPCQPWLSDNDEEDEEEEADGSNVH